MSHINVVVKVGRADSRCVATVEGDNEMAKQIANSILGAEMNKLRESGVDLGRVQGELQIIETNTKRGK